MSDTNDILEKSYLDETSQNGLKIVEQWRHTGITGATPTARKLDARSRTPSIGSTLAGTSLYLTGKKCEPESGDTFRTMLTYEAGGGGGGGVGFPVEVDGAPIIEIFGNLEQSTTNQDRFGDLLEIPVPSGQTGQPITAEVALLLPRYGVRYSRRESSHPGTKAKTYVGRVSSSTFAGDAAGTWLCGPIRGRSTDGGVTYMTTYDLFYDADKWTAKLRWRDDRGVYYDPITEKEIYKVADLNGLGLA